MKPFLDDLSDFVVSLSDGGSSLFSPPLHWVSLANGDADFHDNVIFFGFDGRQASPAVVAKVPRLVENGWMMKTEYDHLMDLWNCIGPEALNYVPKPYALTSLQERPVLLISYVTGESLTRLSPKSFWRDQQQVTDLAGEAARTLRDLHHLTERPLAPEENLRLDLQDKVEKFRELLPLLAEEDQAFAKLEKLVAATAEEASYKVLIQGDFWHGNMIRDDQRRRLMFVDWQFARWSTDVSLDVYFFLLAGALSATGVGPAEERAKRAFRLLRDWHSKVIPGYLAAYGMPERYGLLPPKQGMLLCCLEKATRSALEFGYSHSDDLMWRYLSRELLQWPDSHGVGS